MKTVYSMIRTSGAARCEISTSASRAPSATARRYHALNPELFYWAHASVRRPGHLHHRHVHPPAVVTPRRSRSSTRARSGTASTGSATAASRRPTPTSWPTGTTCSSGSSRTKPSVRHRLHPEGRTVCAGSRTALAGVVGAPPNAYTRLVLVGTMPPADARRWGLGWDAKRERRFQRFAAVDAGTVTRSSTACRSGRSTRPGRPGRGARASTRAGAPQHRRVAQGPQHRGAMALRKVNARYTEPKLPAK